MRTPFRKNILFKSDLMALISQKRDNLIKEIKEITGEEISATSEADLVDVLSDKYEISKLPHIIWEKGKSELSKAKIKGSDLPTEFDVSDPNMVLERKIVNFYIPFQEGKVSLLNYRGQKINYEGGATVVLLSGGHEFVGVPDVVGDQIRFSYLDHYNSPEKIGELFSADQNHFIHRYGELSDALEDFNEWLPKFIKSLIDKRKKEIVQLDDYKAQLPFPIKRAENLPESFIPKPVIKRQKLKPKTIKSKIGTAVREYYISDNNYSHILGILFDCGKMWEKYPRLYRGRDEETLRDQLLFVLVPNIDAVVAGEAYNKKGKTDIAIKQGNVNLFIGECKIWKGPKAFLKTIDQILGYLTWRDSKAAIMNFVPNQNFSKTISTAESTVMEHPNFVHKLEDCEIGWANYRFHLEEDLSTYLTIAIQFYHLPGL